MTQPRTATSPYATRRFYALLNAAGIPKEEKETLCLSFSEGRTEHLGQMQPREINAMLAHLQAEADKLRPFSPPYQGGVAEGRGGRMEGVARKPKPTDRADRMRKKLIGLARSLGWEKPSPSAQMMIADMPRIHHWVEHYGYLNPKKLNAYTEDELPKLLSQFERVHTDTLRRLDITLHQDQ